MAADSVSTEVIPALPAIERAIASIWQDVLALAQLPEAADNFFALGGDSTAMVMVELRVQDEFSIELQPGALLNAPSLRELAHLVEHKRNGSA